MKNSRSSSRNKILLQKCSNFTRVKELKEAKAYAYFSPLTSAQEPVIELKGKKMLMFGSNSYLGLSTHPDVKAAAREAVDRFGSSCTGSRFLNGTLEIHEKLEQRLAAFVGKERAIVFTTGFQANLGTIAGLVGKDDYIITDKTDHASIIDGARLSFGRMLRFNHNSMEDLERVLKSCEENGNGGGKMIVVDGVFSMDGDIAELPGIADAADRYNACLMVDDAHGFGVLGPKGDGTSAHFGLTDRVDLIMGTFSKSFASIGGFVAGHAEVIDYLLHVARPLIFSASLPPAQVAAALASLTIIESEPERRDALWRNTRYLKQHLDALGFDTGCSETPIIPVVVGDDLLCFRMWRALQEEGVFVNPIVSPAVPADHALIRVSIMATHTMEQLAKGLAIFEKVGKRLGII